MAVIIGNTCLHCGRPIKFVSKRWVHMDGERKCPLYFNATPIGPTTYEEES